METSAVLKEGILHKRQRGRRQSSLRGLRFQARLFSLTPAGLEYFDPKKKVYTY